MIIYRELSSLEHDLNIPAKTLYAVSNRVTSHYRPVSVPKKDGTVRRLFVPDAILKQIQKRILEVLLLPMEISPYATAYRDGGSPRRNALPHLAPPMLLKLDIHAFFDSIFYQQVKAAAFPSTIYAEPLRILLTLLCYHKDALPQGAPTSPAISNLVMRDFDNQLGLWCHACGIVYTRYCDDLTFSGSFDKDEVKTYVQGLLRQYGFFLNPKKTVFALPHNRQCVTGIVVNQKPQTPRDFRRALLQEVYYCKKYGIAEHCRRRGILTDEETHLRRLLGQVSYALSVRKDDKKMRAARSDLLAMLRTKKSRILSPK